MASNKRSELMDAIRQTVAGLCQTARFLNKDVVDAVIDRHSELFQALGSQLAREKLFDLTRRVMKSSVELTEAEAQLELGLDFAGFEMPNMIAVPVDPSNPLNGDCEWVPVLSATSADLDSNLRMLDLQIEADQRRRRSIFALRQRVVAIVGEHSELTVAQVASLARELQPA
jgi:hypothetical protein